MNFIDQLTLNCLISKDQLSKLNKKPKEKIEQKHLQQITKHKDQIKSLFTKLIDFNPPDDLMIEVSSTYDEFIKSAINYFNARDRAAEQQRQHDYSVIHKDINYERDANVRDSDLINDNENLGCDESISDDDESISDDESESDSK